MAPIRKKKEAKEVETAGMMRWLLTYADMITLLLAMFILLYAISKINLEKYKEFTEAAPGAFGGKVEIKKKAPESSLGGLEASLQNAYNTIKGIINDKKMAEKIQIVIEERGIRLSFMTDGVFFDIGKADLKPDFEAILHAMAPTLKQITNGIRIEGHTCNMPINTIEFPSNWELSTRRATNVLRCLVDQGVTGTKMSAAGYADTKPVARNDTEENRAKNRRVDLIILRSGESKFEPRSAFPEAAKAREKVKPEPEYLPSAPEEIKPKPEPKAPVPEKVMIKEEPVTQETEKPAKIETKEEVRPRPETIFTPPKVGVEPKALPVGTIELRPKISTIIRQEAKPELKIPVPGKIKPEPKAPIVWPWRFEAKPKAFIPEAANPKAKIISPPAVTSQPKVEVPPAEKIAEPVNKPQTVIVAPAPVASKPAPKIIAPQAVSPKPTLSQIQAALKNAGFYNGVVDGKIGPMTKKAVAAFQKSNGLKADGKVGSKTWEALSRHLSSEPSRSAPAQEAGKGRGQAGVSKKNLLEDGN